jgi:hypothetical protein
MLKNIKKNIPMAAGAFAGGFASGPIKKYIPLDNAWLKAGITGALGLAVMSMDKKGGMIKGAGLGLIAGAGMQSAEAVGIGSHDPIMDLDGLDIEGLDEELNGVNDPLNGTDDPESELP